MGEQDFERVTTRGGDRGESSLYSGERYRKDDLYFECLGDLDELGSLLGVCRARNSANRLSRLPIDLSDIQKILQAICAAVATSPDHRLRSSFHTIDDKEIEQLECAEKTLLTRVRIGPAFVLPGDSPEGADLDWARTVARRAERRLVAVIRDKTRPDLHDCQRWLNRLSDYLFICARFFDQGE